MHRIRKHNNKIPSPLKRCCGYYSQVLKGVKNISVQNQVCIFKEKCMVK